MATVPCGCPHPFRGMGGPRLPPEPPRNDLLGTWRAVEKYEGLEREPETYDWEFRERVVVATPHESGAPTEGGYRADPTRDPEHLDLCPDGADSPVTKAVYAVAGDR